MLVRKEVRVAEKLHEGVLGGPQPAVLFVLVVDGLRNTRASIADAIFAPASCLSLSFWYPSPLP